MGRSKTIFVNGALFYTKDALTSHVRAMIARYPVGFDIGGEDKAFCLALFGFHPEAQLKLASGVTRIEVRLDRFGHKHFQIHRSDGTNDDISWTWCVRHAA